MRFARTISLGREFFLAAEAMKTISVRQFQELYVVAAIVLLRAMMTFLIHWEMDHDARALQDECELERSLRVDD